MLEERAWLARVLDAEGTTIRGAAFAVDSCHVATCAHVVQDAGAGRPGATARVEFPLLGGCGAEVVAEGWAPEKGTAGDFALLRLDDPPKGLRPVPLRAPRSLDRLTFTAYGFPAGYDDGVSTEGRLGKPAGLEWVKLEVASALLVEPGFSGAAVWSDALQAVVAMLITLDKGSEGRVAFAIPVVSLAMRASLITEALPSPLDLDPDRTTHWGPRSRGVHSDRDDAGWLFRRRRALTELVAWVAGDEPPALRAITGTPGSGKSALLARLVTTADRHYRRRIPGLADDDPTVASVGSVDITFHAKDRTIGEFVDHVAELARVTADRPATLLVALDEAGRRLTIVVDALDEATQPKELARLVNDLAAGGSRVLAGCREHLLAQLSDPEPIRLDRSPYLQEADIEHYVHQLLAQGAGRGGEPGHRELAEEIAEAAEGNFLVAQLVAHAVALGDGVARPFPREVSQAFERLLDALPDPDKTRDLLLPVAYALGDGLPDELWLSATGALRRRYEPADLDDLLRGPAASFLVSRLESGNGRHNRLFHAALAETLVAGRNQAADRRRLWQIWTGPLERDGGRDWSSAPDYLRQYGAEHARQAGALDELIADFGFLLVTDPNRMLAALPAATSPSVADNKRAYMQAVENLHSAAPAERASYLEMAARRCGFDALANEIAAFEPDRPWSVRWARWRSVSEHYVAGRQDEPVSAVSLGELDGRPIAISGGLNDFGGDGTIRIWDLASGAPHGEPLVVPDSGVTAVAVGELAGRPIAILGGWDGTIRIWDLASGAPHGEPLVGHDGPVMAVVVGEFDGHPIAVSGGEDRTVRIWDLASGAPHGEPLVGHDGLVSMVALGELDGHPIAVSRGWDGTVQIWDLASGAPHGEPLVGHDDPFSTVAVGELDGRPIVISGGSDGSVRIWDLASGAPHGEPLVGHDGPVVAVAVGELDGRPIAVSGGGDRTVRIWNLASGAPHGEALVGHDGQVSAVAVGELDGGPVAFSAGWDGTVRIWDLASGAPHGEPLVGHSTRRAGVRAVVLGELDGRPVAISGGEDGTVRIWDLASAAPHGEPLVGHDGPVNAVALGELDGRPIVVSGARGSVRVRYLDDEGDHAIAAGWLVCALALDSRLVLVGTTAGLMIVDLRERFAIN